MGSYVKPFGEMSKDDFEEAGGKAANLSEMAQAGFNVPSGFCVTAGSLAHLIEANGLQPEIDAIIASFDYEDLESMEEKTARIRALIENAPIPADLLAEIKAAIQELMTPSLCLVAVRSSVSVRGSSVSSFPGMMDTYHYIRGEDDIIAHIRKCWASLWTSRACYNRYHKGIDHHLGLISPTVQKMVNSEIAGIVFTANPITGSRDELVIESNWGLGESVVSGRSVNDFFLLDKATLAEKQRRIAPKSICTVFDDGRGCGRKEIECTPEMSKKATLDEAHVHELAETCRRIEQHFGAPQDIEWAIERDEFYILQSRDIRNLPA